MYGIDAHKPIYFDRNINSGFESGCHGGAWNNKQTSPDSVRSEALDFLKGTTRKTSPFDGSTASTPLVEYFTSLADRSASSQTIDPEIASALKKLINWLFGDKKDSAGPSSNFEPVTLTSHPDKTVPETEKTVNDSGTGLPLQSETVKIKPGVDDTTGETVTSTTETTDVSEQSNVIVVDTPIVIDGGVFDGKGATYTASSKLGDGGQSETQSPIFILKNGATLKNVNLGENGADGVHVYGGATLENVNWLNVGEDALTVKSEGDVTILGGSAKGASDKVFQINADTNFVLKDFKADGFTTLVRTNGGKQIDADVTIDGGSFSNGTNVFRTDSSLASVTFLSDISLNNVKNWVREGDRQSGV
ncbi:pectate lyase [Rhizobium giardinii]|uniref:Pectate lyase n=1 Tax=Rhizobium giardinii TaxID=56731 RepID=A0A7W8UC25_9HYPH|nr:pectate lyase [Rhizobium giardinii]MBB5536483.1 hypothetical protein [Rhizobium giardinii]